jgi:hypothetical protein
MDTPAITRHASDQACCSDRAGAGKREATSRVKTRESVRSRVTLAVTSPQPSRIYQAA